MQVTTDNITHFQPVSVTIIMETRAELKAITSIARFGQSVAALVGHGTIEQDIIKSVLSNIHYKLENK